MAKLLSNYCATECAWLLSITVLRFHCVPLQWYTCILRFFDRRIGSLNWTLSKRGISICQNIPVVRRTWWEKMPTLSRYSAIKKMVLHTSIETLKTNAFKIKAIRSNALGATKCFVASQATSDQLNDDYRSIEGILRLKMVSAMRLRCPKPKHKMKTIHGSKVSDMEYFVASRRIDQQIFLGRKYFTLKKL